MTTRETSPAPKAYPRLLAVAGICGALAGAPLLAGLVQAGPALAGTTGTTATGGAGLGGSGSGGTGSGSNLPGVATVNVAISASGSGISLRTTNGAMTGRRLGFHGTAPRRYHGRSLELQTMPSGGSTWSNVAKAVLGPKGGFSGSWTPAASGRFTLRAVLLPQTAAGNAVTQTVASTTPQTGGVPIEVFQTAMATLYGPGFYGNKTACGETLTKTTIGVANRTLKCGTKVAIDYDGKVLDATVIDRGPYGTGASWDLTMATGAALGMTETATIATLRASP